MKKHPIKPHPMCNPNEPAYADVVAEVQAFLRTRVSAALAAGISRDRLLLDPGFGFGKTLQHNLDLLCHFDELSIDKLPLLAGISRKSMLGTITGRPVAQLLAGSLAAALLATQRGASILRVHDVSETRDVLAVWQAVNTTEVA